MKPLICWTELLALHQTLQSVHLYFFPRLDFPTADASETRCGTPPEHLLPPEILHIKTAAQYILNGSFTTNGCSESLKATFDLFSQVKNNLRTIINATLYCLCYKVITLQFGPCISTEDPPIACNRTCRIQMAQDHGHSGVNAFP